MAARERRITEAEQKEDVGALLGKAPLAFRINDVREILEFAAELKPAAPVVERRPIEKVIAALAGAQAMYRTIPKTKTARIQTAKGTYQFNYADLGDLVDMLRGPFAKHGLVHHHTIDVDKMRMTTWIHHTSGQFLCSSLPIAAGTTPQALASSITYARRYTLSSLSGAVSEEDDDGSVAEESAQQGRRGAARAPKSEKTEQPPPPGDEEPEKAPRKKAARKKQARKKAAAKKDPVSKAGDGTEALGNVKALWMHTYKCGEQLGMEAPEAEKWGRELVAKLHGAQSSKELSQTQINQVMLAMTKAVVDNTPPEDRGDGDEGPIGEQQGSMPLDEQPPPPEGP